MAYNQQQRVPNVSQYLANLNRVPGAQDIAPQEDFLNDPSMDTLASLDFFDYDAFNDVDLGPVAAQQQQMSRARHQQRKPSGTSEMTLNSPNNFPQFPEFQGFPQLQGTYAPTPQQYGTPAAQQPVTGDKRKAGVAQVSSPLEVEEGSRMAAEEDKRRRNTAASARFRVKKKQREQALEKQAKEMTDRVQKLENTVQKLQMENKWLRELITDKKDQKNLELFEEQQKAEKELETKSAESSTDERQDGVGTDAEDDVDAEADGEDVDA